MNTHQTTSAVSDLINTYAGARNRLWNTPTPPEMPRARLIAVRPQPHRPLPPPKLPYAIDRPKEKVRDVIAVEPYQPDESIAPGLWSTIVAQVCAKHGLTKSEFHSRRRSLVLVMPRYEAMYRMSKETTLTLGEIGKRVGGRDHTTVLYGIRRYEAFLRGKQYRHPMRLITAKAGTAENG